MMDNSTNEMQRSGRSVVADMIKQYKGDVDAAYLDFNTQANKKFEEGKVPNNLYGESVDVFTSLLPIAKDKEVIDAVKDDVNDYTYNSLVYDYAMKINMIVGDEAIPFPDIEPLSIEASLNEYEQALIQLHNIIPNIKDNDRRRKLVEAVNLVQQAIETTKMTMSGAVQ